MIEHDYCKTCGAYNDTHWLGCPEDKDDDNPSGFDSALLETTDYMKKDEE